MVWVAAVVVSAMEALASAIALSNPIFASVAAALRSEIGAAVADSILVDWKRRCGERRVASGVNWNDNCACGTIVDFFLVDGVEWCCGCCAEVWILCWVWAVVGVVVAVVFLVALVWSFLVVDFLATF